jgi:hypothetical protein
MSRLRVVAALAVVLYAFVAQTTELRHHDRTCSPKASSQCEACARGPEYSRVEAGFHLERPTLHAIGHVAFAFEAAPRSGRVLARTGRAPPAA